MRRDIRIYVETELRNYHESRHEWDLLMSDIVNQSPISDGQPRGSGTSNPTESKVVKILTNKRLAQMERTIKAIEKVLANLPEEKYKLIQMRYWDCPRTLTDDGIALNLNIDKRTLYRWIGGILLAVAIELGLVDGVSCQKDVSFSGA